MCYSTDSCCYRQKNYNGINNNPDGTSFHDIHCVKYTDFDLWYHPARHKHEIKPKCWFVQGNRTLLLSWDCEGHTRCNGCVSHMQRSRRSHTHWQRNVYHSSVLRRRLVGQYIMFLIRSNAISLYSPRYCVMLTWRLFTDISSYQK